MAVKTAEGRVPAVFLCFFASGAPAEKNIPAFFRNLGEH
ncbi:Hypothetical protein ACI5QL_01628 [Bacillus velezensis]